ncbi:MAG: 4-hydroxythreonine-4-phosphate dehydrogenase PdxA [Pseudomonadota bacterium]|nr:4-hydroxythreonine-4-phosphate dehydrogenase PdxA [Pseudomonadota bacterium]
MSSASAAPRPLALTMGEPGGVGGEIAAKAWKALRADGPVFFIIDDPARLAALGAPVAEIGSPGKAAGVFPDALPVLPLGARVAAPPGVASPKTAKFVIESIRRAAELALGGEAAGVVTNPISKAALLADGFAFPGHTEYLGELTRLAPSPKGVSARGPVMMLAGPALRTVPVSVHEPLADAARRLSTQAIIHAATVTAEALLLDFGLARPRLAIAGLNPHAGEGGALGREDASVIAPAVEALRKAGVEARGPLPADTMFHEEARAQYDAAICMYHDQALIPVKTLAFHETVNVTLGLPIVRTSPDHGTALDIAGKGAARADSLIAAIRLAAEMAARRSRA